MKKKIFLVGTLVVMSMSAMFVACNSNEPSSGSGGAIQGCTCTFQVPGWSSSTTQTYSASQLNNVGVSSCSEWESYLSRVTDYTSIHCY